jgi:hypothetical protein
MAVDPAVRRKFRKTLEGKLEVAAINNQRVIVSWEVSAAYDRVAIVCHESTFSERVIDHLATSVTRLLGVGKSLEIVDRGLNTVTVECFPQAGSTVLFRRVYALD